MPAEDIIALQAALGELGALYDVATGFVSLRAAAKAELLPQASALAARLRRHLREDDIEGAAVDAAARQIAALRANWRQRLETLRSTPLYQESLAAWEAGHGETLATVLPRLIAGIEHTGTPPALFCGVSLASGHRRPGGRPFLSPETCAQRIADHRANGIPADLAGKEWWDTELAAVAFTADPDAHDSPVVLRIDPADATVPTFVVTGESTFRIYTRTLKVPIAVILHEDASDEWWQAFNESYEDYRVALADHLEERGFAVEIRRRREARQRRAGV